MSQNDFVIEDNTGDQVLIDLNSAFQALASNNRDQNAPSTSYPSQFFANENTGKLTYRDGSNTSTYYNLANLTGGLFIDQASTINGTMTFTNDVIFDVINSAGTITFDADANSNQGALKFTDNIRISLGTSDDFLITHTFSTNLLSAQTDFQTIFQTRTLGQQTGNACFTIQTIDSSGSDSAYQANLNAGQLLYFNNSKKFETTANGITVQGAVTTQDINMSNLESTPNEVDGTQGSWTIQEGLNDLYLINRISGKKYKFNLTEIT